MAENRLDEPVIGVTFDGTGIGTDETIWGGEFLVGDYQGFRLRRRISAQLECPAVIGPRVSLGGWRWPISPTPSAEISAWSADGRLDVADDSMLVGTAFPDADDF